jgi:hypothetical protein
VTRFLTSLAVDGRVAGSTQNQALSALLFLYREVQSLQPHPPARDTVRLRRQSETNSRAGRYERCACGSNGAASCGAGGVPA